MTRVALRSFTGASTSGDLYYVQKHRLWSHFCTSSISRVFRTEYFLPRPPNITTITDCCYIVIHVKQSHLLSLKSWLDCIPQAHKSTKIPTHSSTKWLKKTTHSSATYLPVHYAVHRLYTPRGRTNGRGNTFPMLHFRSYSSCCTSKLCWVCSTHRRLYIVVEDVFSLSFAMVGICNFKPCTLLWR